MRQVNNNL